MSRALTWALLLGFIASVLGLPVGEYCFFGAVLALGGMGISMMVGADIWSGRLGATAGGLLLAGLVSRVLSGSADAVSLSPSAKAGLFLLAVFGLLAGGLLLFAKGWAMRPPAPPRPRPQTRGRARIVQPLQGSLPSGLDEQEAPRRQAGNDDLNLLGGA